jgi:hypothetical protein
MNEFIFNLSQFLVLEQLHGAAGGQPTPVTSVYHHVQHVWRVEGKLLATLL